MPFPHGLANGRGGRVATRPVVVLPRDCQVAFAGASQVSLKDESGKDLFLLVRLT